ncbi:MinD/ParA family protein [Halobacillus karajensis]|uniref:Flagellum site-determining protein YlxH n=1 Tax=Halobacillus karajensis TaxID=195088 RepID=A0A024P201_9BACI|nr:MinD/ParA family protein [Halobacillus karajensis]CDQ19725.1 Flagellum site-determining protein YlxH [Halobacillus karajensis]CDQ22185.1 Flagellum site-determining protein YlxH [Halobacillus karajensis]CDQ28026.1 Flagellum site-determining protein YlxH [Halobacillus karajensis]
MKDQADLLRRRMKEKESQTEAKTIAIVNGKGRVGKSAFCMNFALELIKRNKKVLLFDLDIGMGNSDFLMGKTAKHRIVDLFRGRLSIPDIIELGPESLSYIAAGSGLSQIFTSDYFKFASFQREFEKITRSFDYILFDMGAGTSQDRLNFISSAHEAIVVTTPDPTSLTDSYAMIKHLVDKGRDVPIKILVNRARSESLGKTTYSRLSFVAKKFLHVDVCLLGILPDDRAVLQALHHQKPFVLHQPNSKVSQSLSRIVVEYVEDSKKVELSTSFMDKLKRFVFLRVGNEEG